MKTILIVIAGMADLPDPLTLRETPLTVANIPSMDTLASRGDITCYPPVEDSVEISHKNALLSLLGYDLRKGEPSTEELMEYGLDPTAEITSYPSLRPYVIPGFSGHGECITTSAWVRGVAKCALIKPLDIYSPGSSDAEILETLSKLTSESIVKNEFVLVYVDTPLRASLKGNYDSKLRALEIIDRHLVAPIADYVWKSELMIHLAIATDLVTPWHRRRPAKLNVPAIVYFNNHDREGDPERRFTEVESMLSQYRLTAPTDLIKYLSNFYVSEEEENQEDLPF